MPSSPKPPAQLTQLQEWLSDSILRGSDRAGLAGQYLTASNSMTSTDRFQVYVTDYRSRCLDSLREDFSGLDELLGHVQFLNLMDQYLNKFPSRSFTLYFLGQDLLGFVTREYHAEHRAVVLEVVAYEWACMWANLAPVNPMFDFAQLSDKQKTNLSQIPLRLESCVTLLKLSHDVRTPKIMTEPLNAPLYLAVYRKNHQTCEKVLEPALYALLQVFKTGTSLDQALDQVCQQQNDKHSEALLKNATIWFQMMVAEQWLVHPLGYS